MLNSAKIISAVQRKCAMYEKNKGGGGGGAPLDPPLMWVGLQTLYLC